MNARFHAMRESDFCPSQGLLKGSLAPHSISSFFIPINTNANPVSACDLVDFLFDQRAVTKYVQENAFINDVFYDKADIRMDERLSAEQKDPARAHGIQFIDCFNDIGGA